MRYQPVEAAIKIINENYERTGQVYGTPVTKDILKMSRLLGFVKSDPFIPAYIRDMVVDFLDNRLKVTGEVYGTELEAYGNALRAKEREPATPNEIGVIHNRIVEELRDRGCGISDNEREVHEIRKAIQQYFEKFIPK